MQNDLKSDEPKPEYLKGFNEGYALAYYMPEIAEKIGKSLGDSERSEGFREGRQQFVLEKNKNIYRSWLAEDMAEKSFDKEPDLDKGDIEPEKE